MKESSRQTLSGNLDLIYRTGKFQFSNKLTIDYLRHPAGGLVLRICFG